MHEETRQATNNWMNNKIHNKVSDIYDLTAHSDFLFECPLYKYIYSCTYLLTRRPTNCLTGQWSDWLVSDGRVLLSKYLILALPHSLEYWLLTSLFSCYQCTIDLQGSAAFLPNFWNMEVRLWLHGSLRFSRASGHRVMSGWLEERDYSPILQGKR